MRDSRLVIHVLPMALVGTRLYVRDRQTIGALDLAR
jgi:hypothetical protein